MAAVVRDVQIRIGGMRGLESLKRAIQRLRVLLDADPENKALAELADDLAIVADDLDAEPQQPVVACNTCRFWKLIRPAATALVEQDEYGHDVFRKLDQGQCRIRSTSGPFPERQSDDGCGEHQPIATKSETVTLVESDNEIIDGLVMPPPRVCPRHRCAAGEIVFDGWE